MQLLRTVLIGFLILIGSILLEVLLHTLRLPGTALKVIFILMIILRLGVMVWMVVRLARFFAARREQ